MKHYTNFTIVLIAVILSIIAFTYLFDPFSAPKEQTLRSIDHKLDSIYIYQKKVVDSRRFSTNTFVNHMSFAPHFNSDDKIKEELSRIKEQLQGIYPVSQKNISDYQRIEKKYFSSAAIMEFLNEFRLDKEYIQPKEIAYNDWKLRGKIDTAYYTKYYNTFDILTNVIVQFNKPKEDLESMGFEHQNISFSSKTELDKSNYEFVGWHKNNKNTGEFELVSDDINYSDSTYLHKMYKNKLNDSVIIRVAPTKLDRLK